jgi:stage III sporulation protein AD
MDIIQIIGIGIISVVIISVLKAGRPDTALMVAIAAGLLILTLTTFKLNSVITILDNLGRKASIGGEYTGILLKIIGIAYLVEFGGEICKDAGESSIASKIELAGKVFIIVIAAPIFTTLLQYIVGLL